MNNKLENQNISSHILFPSVSVHYSIAETFICRVNNISSAKPKMLLFHSSKIEGSNWLFFLFGSYISIYLYLYIYIYIYLSISLYKYIYIYIYIYYIIYMLSTKVSPSPERLQHILLFSQSALSNFPTVSTLLWEIVILYFWKQELF